MKPSWRRNPEQVAWGIILCAFGLCVSLSGGTLWGAQWWLRTATVEQEITNAPNGTVLVTRPERTVPEVNLVDVPLGALLETQDTSQATLVFAPPQSTEALATFQVFGNTRLSIEAAASPRFSFSEPPHIIRLKLLQGRVRAFVGVEVSQHPVEVQIESLTGAVTRVELPGSNVSVEAINGATIVTVREGQAEVSGAGAVITLQKDERAEVAAQAAPQGPLPAEQNLIQNADFAPPLNTAWQIELALPADPQELPGLVEVQTINGRRALKFNRRGNNWGQVGVTQALNRDVQGLKSLRLHLDVRLDFQDLSNCGLQGTECPLMVKLSYVDIYGNPGEWLQGFYYRADPSTNAGLTFCAPCAPVRFVHQKWPQTTWQTFDSSNLLAEFNPAAPAATLKAITIYASGHSFTSWVTDLQLLTSE